MNLQSQETLRLVTVDSLKTRDMFHNLSKVVISNLHRTRAIHSSRYHRADINSLSKIKVISHLRDIHRIKVVCPGLELGQVKKNRFEPAHALALWLKKCKNIQDFPANSQEIRKYLEGQVLPGTCKGWCLITVDGYGIGWGKGDGTTLKNHYPKGLRRNS